MCVHYLDQSGLVNDDFLNITGMIYKYDYSMDEGSGTECNPYEHEWAGYTNQFYEEV